MGFNLASLGQREFNLTKLVPHKFSKGLKRQNLCLLFCERGQTDLGKMNFPFERYSAHKAKFTFLLRSRLEYTSPGILREAADVRKSDHRSKLVQNKKTCQLS